MMKGHLFETSRAPGLVLGKGGDPSGLHLLEFSRTIDLVLEQGGDPLDLCLLVLSLVPEQKVGPDLCLLGIFRGLHPSRVELS